MKVSTSLDPLRRPAARENSFSSSHSLEQVSSTTRHPQSRVSSVHTPHVSGVHTPHLSGVHASHVSGVRTPQSHISGMERSVTQRGEGYASSLFVNNEDKEKVKFERMREATERKGDEENIPAISSRSLLSPAIKEISPCFSPASSRSLILVIEADALLLDWSSLLQCILQTVLGRKISSEEILNLLIPSLSLYHTGTLILSQQERHVREKEEKQIGDSFPRAINERHYGETVFTPQQGVHQGGRCEDGLHDEGEQKKKNRENKEHETKEKEGLSSSEERIEQGKQEKEDEVLLSGVTTWKNGRLFALRMACLEKEGREDEEEEEVDEEGQKKGSAAPLRHLLLHLSSLSLSFSLFSRTAFFLVPLLPCFSLHQIKIHRFSPNMRRIHHRG